MHLGEKWLPFALLAVLSRSVQSTLNIVKVFHYFSSYKREGENFKFLIMAVHCTCNLCGDLNRLKDRNRILGVEGSHSDYPLYNSYPES